MKIREIIIERITLTPNLPDVKNSLKTAIMAVFNRKPKTIPDRMDFKFMSINNTLFVDGIETALYTFLDSKNISANIKFLKLPAGVGGSYLQDENTIVFSSSLLVELLKLLYKFYTTGEDVKNELDNIINRMAGVFLHELTHVIQVKSGGKNHEKSMVYDKEAVDQYVNKLEPSKKKQAGMLKTAGITRNQINLILAKDDLSNPKNLIIYKAQPEEITAFAHEYLVKQLSPIVDKPIEEQITFINNSLTIHYV